MIAPTPIAASRSENRSPPGCDRDRACPATMRPPGPSGHQHAPGLIGAALLLVAIHGASIAAILRQPAAPRPAGWTTPLRINPNTAAQADLMLLPGIGPALSKAIVDERNPARDPFRNPDDLERVHGIGPRTVERIRPFLTFESGESPPQPAQP